MEKNGFQQKKTRFLKKVFKKWQKYTDKLQLGVLILVEGHKFFLDFFILWFSLSPENTRVLANSVLYDFLYNKRDKIKIFEEFLQKPHCGFSKVVLYKVRGAFI